MNTATSLGLSASSGSRAMQLGMVALLGFFVIGVLGFVQMDVLHNAGHDYRHSMAFPCH